MRGPSQFHDEVKIYDGDFEASTRLQNLFNFIDRNSSVEIIALERSVRIEESASHPDHFGLVRALKLHSFCSQTREARPVI